MNKVRHILFCAYLSLTALLLHFMATPSVYSQPEKAEPFEHLLKMSIEELMDLHVTIASRSPEKVSEAPSTVTVFTRQEIVRMGVDNLAELLHHVPGFQVSRIGNYGGQPYLFVRGGESINSAAVLVLIDGVRINDNLAGGTLPINSYINIRNAQRIEIIRGPGSAMYGANAFLCVINIITAQDRNRVEITAGSHQSRGFSLQAAHTNAEVQISVFASAYRDEGQTYSDFNDAFGREDSTKDPRHLEDLYATAETKHFRINFRHAERALDQMFSLTFGIFNEINRFDSSSDTLSLSTSLNPARHLNLDLRAYYSEFYYDLQTVISADLPQGPYIAHVVSREQDAGIEADLSYTLSENNRLHFGTFFSYAHVPKASLDANYDNQTMAYQDQLVYQGRHIKDEGRYVSGIYLQAHHTFNNHVSATAGGRFDWYSDFGEQLSPRLALLIRHPFNGHIKAMYGEAFRPPSFFELYLQNQGVLKGDPELDAERVQTTEFAWMQNFKIGEAGITYFHNRIKDKLEFDFGESLYVNGDKESIDGLEAALKVYLGSHYFVRAAYTAISRGGRRVAKDYGSLMLNAEYGKWNINVSDIYMGNVEELADQGYSSYHVINGHITYDITPSITARFRVKNLLDENIYAYGQAFDRVPMRGREVTAGLAYRW